MTLIDKCLDEYNNLDTDVKRKKYVNIPKEKNFNTYKEMINTKDVKFEIIPYHFYKNYSNLVKELEICLDLYDPYESDSEYETES